MKNVQHIYFFLHVGHVFDQERGYFVKYSESDPMDHAYSTISYANGPGFYDHFVANFTDIGTESPWKDVRLEDSEDLDYKQPAMMPAPNDSETHSGEDVGIFATGNLF